MASSIQIAKPRTDTLVTAPTFKVVVRTGEPIAALRAALGERDVGSQFRHRGDRRWTATLRRTDLRKGSNQLVVEAAGAGERGAAATRVLKGKRSRGFVKLRAPRRARSSLSSTIRLAEEADLFLHARLNGRGADGAFGPELGTRRRGELSPNYGLRFGFNKLRVRAARSDGTYDAEARRIFVSRKHPLAAAGRNTHVEGTGAVRLDGSRSLATRRGAKLRFRWRLAESPPGSDAELKHRRAVRPRLKPDVAGAYRVELAVFQGVGGGGERETKAAASGTDNVVITVAESTPPLGIPLNTIANPGDDENLGIAFNGRQYPANFTQNAIQLMAIDRKTGAVLTEQAYPGSAADAASALTQVSKFENDGPKPLVVLSATGLGAPTLDPSWNGVVKAVTGETLPDSVFGTAADGFSAVGVPGTRGAAFLGRSWTALNPSDLENLPGALNGYLQLDTSGYLTFVPALRTALDSSGPKAPNGQNEIVIGSQAYPSGPLEEPSNPGTPCGANAGGFQIQTVNAEFLNAGSSATFATNGCGAGEDEAGQQQMADLLTQGSLYETEGAQLIVIQSIGSPRGANDSNWSSLADAIAAVGGNEWVFRDMSSTEADSYALVTGTDQGGPLPGFPVVESAQHESGNPAHITGVLKQTRAGYTAPREASPVDMGYDFGLSLLTYQPEAGPPFPPASTDAKEQSKALQYIAGKVLKGFPDPEFGTSCYVPADGKPDIRSEYCNPNVLDRWASTDADGFTAQLQNATYPGPSAGFSQDTWNALRCQFIGVDCGASTPYDEWGGIAQVWSDFDDLKNFILSNQSTALADANQTAKNVADTLGPKADGNGVWADIFANILAGFTYVDIGEAGGPVGILSTVGFLVEDDLNAPDGTPLLGEFDVDATEFLTDLSATFTSSYDALDKVRNIILTSETKLQTMINGDLIPGNLDSATPAVTLGVARFSFKALLPDAYELVRLERFGVNAGITDARDYQCGAADIEVNYSAFPDAPKSAQWLPTGGHLWVLVEKGAALPDGFSRIKPPTPPATLTDPLFKPYATDATNVIPTQFAFAPDTFFPSTWDLSKAPVVSDC